MSKYILQQENDFDQVSKDTTLINSLVNKSYAENVLQQVSSKKYFLFVYRKNDIGIYNLNFWSTQITEPDAYILSLNVRGGFIQLSNGYYEWRKSDRNGIVTVGLIPIKWNYAITNEYLRNTFTIGDNLDKNYDISFTESNASIHSKEGQFLFSFEQKPGNMIQGNNKIAIVLRILAVLFVFLFIHLTATFFVVKNFYKGAILLVILITGLRVISYFTPIPLNLRQFELFDPAIYGSNSILRSLGDLLINGFLFLWIVLFIRHYIQDTNVSFNINNRLLRWLFILAGITVLLLSTFICGHIFRTLVADSQISFDVINFFTLDGFSIMGFLVMGILAIGYFFLTQIVIFLLQPLLPKNILVLIISITVIGLMTLTLRINDKDVIFELGILVWLLLYLFLLNNKHLFLLASKIISSRLIFWLFFFSVSITLIIILENNKKELDKRKNYAETLSAKADPSSERLMSTVLTDFRNKNLAPIFDRFKNDSTNRLLKDSLLNENFSGYLNKYDTRIYTFDEKEQPLFNQDSTNFNTLTTVLNSEAKPTAVPDLYYYDVSYDKFTYISKKQITDTAGNTIGYVFILASPKKYKTDALYPELFLKGYNNSIENSPVYSYAVYNKMRLVNSHNEYAFSWQLLPGQLSNEEFSTERRNGYDELWYRAGSDKVVIIVKHDNLFIESITLFSYLFCSFLFVTALFWFLNALVRSRLRWKEIRTYWKVSIRNQVHGTIIFISLLSFLIIGIATILFFINRYHENNKEKLSRTIQVMENQVRNSLNEIMVFDDVVKVYDEGYREKLELLISKISEVHAVDINLYDLDGNLKVSSLPLPYNKGILSNKMDPAAFYHLNSLKEIQYFKEEKIGSLSYLSNYVPVIDESGREYAYLNIPYFTSQTKLEQEVAFFLVAIINLNAFIFLIAGIVAFFLTNRITSSFSFISAKMQEVNLGKMNEAIIWKRNDEIGQLVKEYNKMVGKLDYSAVALAKSEREGAWREMARQVAHEIKNPLTPMKLSLQFLQKAIENNAENVKELTKSVANTLVEQIDHLNQIAGEFSQFANIGNPQNEVFNLNDILSTVIRLHEVEENVKLDWKPVNQKVMVSADRTQINRLFTNLIRNAIQAVPARKPVLIEIEEVLHDNKVLVLIKDNGSGIAQDIQAKIFTPNFTTKTSGTGLGLAMCKSIIEQCRGDIWFETKEGEGTVFYIELPIIDE